MILGPGAIPAPVGGTPVDGTPVGGNPGRFAVLVPAHNAGAGLARVLDALAEPIGWDRVLVVDDGSTDGSPDAARQRGVAVFAHSTRQGKGAALASGFVVLGRQGWPWILTLDADGQHDPSYIPAFVEAARRHRLDLVLGNRMAAPGPMPWDRRLSNSLSSRLISWRLGARLDPAVLPVPRDSQCGFRLYRTALLARLDLACRRFDMESELLLKAVLTGARVGSVPVPSLYPSGPSGIRRLGDSLRFARLLAASLEAGFTPGPDPAEEHIGSL